jgi:pilus assembly protein CpaD
MNNMKTFALVVTASLMSACSMNSPTWVNQSRVEIHNDQFADTFETAKMNDSAIRAVAIYHYRYGNGPMNLVVGYDPKSKTNTQAKANSEAERISRELKRNGVRELNVQTIPLQDTGNTSLTTVTFPALIAKAPAKCGTIPGYNSPTTVPNTAEGIPPYELGCTIESLMAQQISRPGDLLGRPGFETNADGRRQENVLDQRGYYSDKPNQPLKNSESASSK